MTIEEQYEQHKRLVDNPKSFERFKYLVEANERVKNGGSFDNRVKTEIEKPCDLSEKPRKGRPREEGTIKKVKPKDVKPKSVKPKKKKIKKVKPKSVKPRRIAAPKPKYIKKLPDVYPDFVTCVKCNMEKHKSDFPKNSTKRGHRLDCKVCKMKSEKERKIRKRAEHKKVIEKIKKDMKC